uniref:Dual specificity phosphatase n=1 Tax=Pithovirus LCDPAC01 TaxID=2506600 RepID=A0A481YQ75_9VIRU|nr:MAG: dual specificity phosphatase [Pithovirus LCDPAC01]
MKLSPTLYYGINIRTVYPIFNVDHFIDLTEKFDYCSLVKNATYTKFSIPDRKAPSIKRLNVIIQFILSLKGVVYIFCKGGHGRSGTVAAAVYGKQHHIRGKEVIEFVNRKWHNQRDLSKIRPKIRKLGSPQTKVQKRQVTLFLAQNLDSLFVQTLTDILDNKIGIRGYFIWGRSDTKYIYVGTTPTYEVVISKSDVGEFTPTFNGTLSSITIKEKHILVSLTDVETRNIG